MHIESFESPVGEIVVGMTDLGIMMCSFGEYFGGRVGGCVCCDERRGPGKRIQRIARDTEQALKKYFGGDAAALADLPVAITGTVFQRAVWNALRRIPPGQTRSYGEIAHQIRRPSAVRAVGNACGANPIVLMVPCHRVIATNGGLGGFSAGLERKEFLLQLESSHIYERKVIAKGRGEITPRAGGLPFST